MLHAFDLRTEYKNQPLGMDEPCPRLSYKLKGDGKFQCARRITACKDSGEVVWDSGFVRDDETLQILWAGRALEPFTRYYWQVEVTDDEGETSPASEAVFFETGFLNYPWSALWVGNVPGIYRRRFQLNKTVVKARLYVTALGVYTAYINGKNVSEDLFTPGWSDYYARVQYQAYDVTGMVAGGENVLGFELSSGWYCGKISRAWARGQYTFGNLPAFKCELHLTYDDGSLEIIPSDKRFSTLLGCVNEISEIFTSDIYDGETQIARKGGSRWSLPGNNDMQDYPVSIVRSDVPVVWQSGAPVRSQQYIKPVAVTKRGPGHFIVDFGQNLSGREVVRLRNTQAGAILIFRHGEMLNEDGSVYLENLRDAQAQTSYTCCGKEEETVEARHTFYGFRYLDITGWQEETLDAGDIFARVIYSDLPRTGYFSGSDPLLNQLYSNILWGQFSNFLDVPTDCPQRNERLGWSGDTQVFANTATYNSFAPEFYTKYMIDLNYGRTDDGAFPQIAPNPYKRTNPRPGASGWSDAGVIIPWIMFVKYGDTRMLEQYFSAMSIYLDGQIRNAGNSLIVKNAMHGDWLNANCATSEEFISTAFLGGMSALLAKIANILKRYSEAEKYHRLFLDVKAAFGEKFFSADGDILEKTQTAALLAFHFKLVPDNAVARTKTFLVNDIRITHDTHLTTGFLGTPLLLPVLTELGEVELAYDLLFQQSYPGWLYPVLQGATTMWERWNSWTKEQGFADVCMNSFNHYAYGAVGEWFYETIAGISPDMSDWKNAAFKHFRLAPQICTQLSHAEAEYDSFRGKIRSAWKKVDGKLVWEFEIPANTTAEIILPLDRPMPQISGISQNEEGKWIAVPGAYKIELTLN